jgi:hypothetical protein
MYSKNTLVAHVVVVFIVTSFTHILSCFCFFFLVFAFSFLFLLFAFCIPTSSSDEVLANIVYIDQYSST